MRLHKFITMLAIASVPFLTAGDCGKDDTGLDDTAGDADTDTDTDTDTDSGDGCLDTGIELWALEGSGALTVGTSYSGTTRMYDEVVSNTHCLYNVGDILCEYVYPAAHDTTNFSPTLACTGCDFSLNLSHSSYTTTNQIGTYCDEWYGGQIDDGTAWNWGLGYHPDYAGTGPTLMYYAPADPAATPPTDAEWHDVGYPYGTASWDNTTFAWWMMLGMYYYY